MKIANRQFMISKASRQRHEDSLIEEAIAAFRARAQLATQAFDGKGYRLVSLDLDSAGFRPLVARQRVASEMYASVSSQSKSYQEIEAGTSTVSITASGVIEIEK